MGLLVLTSLGWAGNFKDLLHKAGEGDSVAMLEAGIQLAQGEQPASTSGQVLYLLQLLAEKGNTKAMVWQGRTYRDVAQRLDPLQLEKAQLLVNQVKFIYLGS